MRIKKAVIPVAGLGTRLLPATKTVPKELLPIVDVPAIQYVVQEAVDSGIDEITFVTGRGKDGIEDHFDESPELVQVLEQRGQTELVKQLKTISKMVEVVSVRQKRPLGLGHAVLCARDLVGGEPFVVLLPDDIIDAEVPCVRQLLDVFERKKESVLALRRVPKSEAHRYGIVDGKRMSRRLCRIETVVEKPKRAEAPSALAIVGRYIFRPEIFSLLEKVAPGKGGEIQLTDGIAGLLRERHIYGYEFSGTHYDVGDKLGLVRATVAYALKRDDLREPLRKYLAQAVKERR